MELEGIIKKYIDAAIKHGEETEKGNYRLVNKQYDILARCYNELKLSGEIGINELKKLLEHPNDYVRLWASAHIIVIDPIKAKIALLDLSKRPGYLGFDAKMTLSEWEKGNLKF